MVLLHFISISADKAFYLQVLNLQYTIVLTFHLFLKMFHNHMINCIFPLSAIIKSHYRYLHSSILASGYTLNSQGFIQYILRWVLFLAKNQNHSDFASTSLNFYSLYNKLPANTILLHYLQKHFVKLSLAFKLKVFLHL